MRSKNHRISLILFVEKKVYGIDGIDMELNFWLAFDILGCPE
jgi:hypothetical protein